MLHEEIQGATRQPEAALCMLEDVGAATSPAASQQLLLSPGGPGWALRSGLRRVYSPESGVARVPSLMLMVLGTPLRSTPQPSVAEVFPGFSEIRLQWFFLDPTEREVLKTLLRVL